MVNDEQHYVTYDKDPSMCCWNRRTWTGWSTATTVKNRGGLGVRLRQGRVVFTAIGHTNHAMWIPAHSSYRREPCAGY